MEDLKVMINVIYEDNHLLVVEKPINIPVQADESKDNDLLTILKNYVKSKYNKPGNVYLGLVHRLDRPVSGIMVFAKTSKAASRLSEQIRNKDFDKKYVAIVMNDIESNGTLKDKLLKDEKTNIVSINSNGKEAILHYRKIAFINNMSLVDIDLETGRSHQIRVQFSHHGNPLYGDQKYNHNSKVGEQIALFAYSLSFNHPINNEKLSFTLPLPKTNPWTLFDSKTK